MPMTAYTITFGIDHETDPSRNRDLIHDVWRNDVDCHLAERDATGPERSSGRLLARLTGVARTFGFLLG
jgi:hypothetical protein